jgi:hypothetical protein
MKPKALTKVKKITPKKSWADKMEQDHSVVKKLDKGFCGYEGGQYNVYLQSKND